MNSTLHNQGLEPLAAFAVRLSKTHQVVGVFVAVELNQLADLVLQCVDPTKTEYLVLGPGGICTDLSNTAQWPARELRNANGEFEDFDPADEDPIKDAKLDEQWWLDIDRGDWHPLDWDLPDQLALRRSTGRVRRGQAERVSPRPKRPSH